MNTITTTMVRINDVATTPIDRLEYLLSDWENQEVDTFFEQAYKSFEDYESRMSDDDMDVIDVFGVLKSLEQDAFFVPEIEKIKTVIRSNIDSQLDNPWGAYTDLFEEEFLTNKFLDDGYDDTKVYSWEESKRRSVSNRDVIHFAFYMDQDMAMEYCSMRAWEAMVERNPSLEDE